MIESVKVTTEFKNLWRETYEGHYEEYLEIAKGDLSRLLKGEIPNSFIIDLDIEDVNFNSAVDSLKKKETLDSDILVLLRVYGEKIGEMLCNVNEVKGSNITSYLREGIDDDCHYMTVYYHKDGQIENAFVANFPNYAIDDGVKLFAIVSQLINTTINNKYRRH